jgi:hypothetical protein
VSSLAPVRAAAASFLEELGAARVILPARSPFRSRGWRQGVSLSRWRSSFSTTVAYSGRGRHTLHLPPQMGGPLCLDHFVFGTRRRSRAQRRKPVEATAGTVLALVQLAVASARPTRVFRAGPGDRAIRSVRAGVTAVKVVGRGPIPRSPKRPDGSASSALRPRRQDDVKALPGLEETQYAAPATHVLYRDVDPKGSEDVTARGRVVRSHLPDGPSPTKPATT